MTTPTLCVSIDNQPNTCHLAGVGSSVYNAIETTIHQQLASLLHPMDVHADTSSDVLTNDRRTDGDGCAKKSEPITSNSNNLTGTADTTNQTTTATENSLPTNATLAGPQATAIGGGEGGGGKNDASKSKSSSNGNGGKTLLSLLSLSSKPTVDPKVTNKVTSSRVVGSVDNYTRERELTIQQLTSQCRSLQDALTALQTSYDTLRFESDEQRMQLDTLKEEASRKDKEIQEMLLQSYDKGKQAAIFERQQLLEELTGYTDDGGKKGKNRKTPAGLSVPELLYKLQTTQADLDRWQSIACEKTYSDGEKPDTEPDIVLHFLRDSMYHYLTDPRTADQHLSAIIGMLGFTEEQLKKIESVRDRDHHHHR